MRIQLWSYNYDPEPTGIAPVSRSWAQAMRVRGHEIHVVAAHPHYPEPKSIRGEPKNRPIKSNATELHHTSAINIANL